MLTLGDLSRYNPEKSFIINFFDNNESDRISEGSTLIRIRVLQTVAYLSRSRNVKSNPKVVINTLKKIGYEDERSKQVVKFLIDRNIINTNDRTAPHRKFPERVGDLHLTRAGAQYLGWLIYELMYSEDVQDAVHWLTSQVPYPRHETEGRRHRQERVNTLVRRIQRDEEAEKEHVEEDNSCDKALYEAVIQESFGKLLAKKHATELELIKRVRPKLEGEWHFRQTIAPGCTNILGTGNIRIVKNKEGKLCAYIDTAKIRTSALVEQDGWVILIWVTNPQIRITGRLKDNHLKANCNCGSAELAPPKGCIFDAVRVG
jgi:hypothetical protein